MTPKSHTNLTQNVAWPFKNFNCKIWQLQIFLDCSWKFSGIILYIRWRTEEPMTQQTSLFSKSTTKNSPVPQRILSYFFWDLSLYQLFWIRFVWKFCFLDVFAVLESNIQVSMFLQRYLDCQVGGKLDVFLIPYRIWNQLRTRTPRFWKTIWRNVEAAQKSQKFPGFFLLKYQSIKLWLRPKQPTNIRIIWPAFSNSWSNANLTSKLQTEKQTCRHPKKLLYIVSSLEIKLNVFFDLKNSLLHTNVFLFCFGCFCCFRYLNF